MTRFFLFALCGLAGAAAAHGQGVWGDPGSSSFQARTQGSHFSIDANDFNFGPPGCSTLINGSSQGAEYNAWGFNDDCAVVMIDAPCRNCPAGPAGAPVPPALPNRFPPDLGGCLVSPSNAMIAVPGFADGFGWSFANSSVEGNCSIRGSGNAQARYSGVGTSELSVNWFLNAQAGSGCECTEQIPPNDPRCNSSYRYCALGKADMAATIRVTVDGVPAGTPVLIHASWSKMVHALYDPEDPVTPDDPAQIAVAFAKLAGGDLVPPNTGLNNQDGVLLLPPGGGSGVISAVGGDTIVFTISASATAAVEYEPKVCYFHQDQSMATVNGQLVLSIDQPPSTNQTPPYAYPVGTFAEFSLDIGSDAEMSDPTIDLNEVFDPGDTYPWNGPPLPPGGADGIRDDALIFGGDYWPQAPDGPPPLTGALTCSGRRVNDILNGSRFDLDGSDTIGEDLVPLIPPGPLADIIFRSQYNIGCVYRPDNLVVSFDDDDQSHYAGSATGFCGTPVATSGGFNTRPTFGTTAGRDEVVGLVTLYSPAPMPAAQALGMYPVLDEANLHVNLAPNPDASEADDDDVDALDVAAGGCDWWYISADHEATGQDSFINLDAGGIYRVNPLGGSPVLVIDESIHLGVPEDTDIDAFEFVWLPHPSSAGEAMALLFSVSADDWLTIGIDESGGLNPGQIYGSFLNGTYFEYLGYTTPVGTFVSTPFEDDIDALTASPVPFVVSPCTIAQSLVFHEGYEFYPLGPLAGMGGWQAWPNPPGGSGAVSAGPASGGAQSARIGFADNVVQEVSVAPFGVWTATANVYLPSAVVGNASFNLLNTYDPTLPVLPDYWSVRLRFDANNDMVIDDLSGNVTSLVRDQWTAVRAEIDLAADQVDLYYAGNLLSSGSWTHGLPQASLDLAAINLEGQNISEMYFDDIAVRGVLDCNANLAADVCDLASGASQDCQGNGVPDECDIAGGTAADCQPNGTPDECDVSSGVSLDTNLDGIPDECQLPAPVIVRAVSRKVAIVPRAGGFCDTDLLPVRNSEPHHEGITELHMDFSAPPGDPTGSAISLEWASCAAPAFVAYTGSSSYSGIVVGNELILYFTPGLENARTYRITFGPPITSVSGQVVEVRGLIADVNGNGYVNAIDRSVVVGAWTGGGLSCPTDVNMDLSTNATDRSIVVGAWTGGANCAP